MKLKKINKKPLRLALDGFSASGKSLGAKLISKKYKLKLLNSGLLYRFAAYLILKNKPKNNILFLIASIIDCCKSYFNNFLLTASAASSSAFLFTRALHTK